MESDNMRAQDEADRGHETERQKEIYYSEMNGHNGHRKSWAVAYISKQWQQAHVRSTGTGRAQFGSSHVTYETSCTL